MNPADATDTSAELSELHELEKALPNQYRLLCKVSQGGMGAIYKGQNRYTGAEFAIKVLLPRYAQDSQALHRFVFEAKAASSLKHPNICRVHDFGVSDEQVPYLVMDWVNGVSLQKKIERDGPMSTEEACLIILQVAQALEHAHQLKLVHRDLKPDNIMLRRVGTDRVTEVQVVDFGIAKVLQDGEDHQQNLTTTGKVLGTPLFMSPEQARGRELDGRSDIYSLGCVMYFVLSGRPPFNGESTVDTIYKHVNEPPPEIVGRQISAPLKTIMLKCLEKHPNDRYRSMKAIADDLLLLQTGANLPPRILAKERQKVRSIIGLIATFVIGFGLTYALSIALQSGGSKPAAIAPAAVGSPKAIPKAISKPISKATPKAPPKAIR